MPKGDGYLTPQEVLDRYPALRDFHGMSEQTIALLLRHHILWGMYDNGKRLPLIRENSVRHFIKYLNESLDRHRIPDQD
jgi:hypothetical protein